MKKILILIVSLVISITSCSKKIKNPSDSKLILSKADSVVNQIRHHIYHGSHGSHSSHASHVSHYSQMQQGIDFTNKDAIKYREGITELQKRLCDMLQAMLAAKNIDISGMSIGLLPETKQNHNLDITFYYNDEKYIFNLIGAKWYQSSSNYLDYYDFVDKGVIDVLSEVASIYFKEEKELYEKYLKNLQLD